MAVKDLPYDLVRGQPDRLEPLALERFRGRGRGGRAGGRLGRGDPVGGPPALLSGEHRAHEPHHGRLGGERLHRAVPPLDLAVRALLHVVRPDLLPVLAGEGHEGERVLPRALEDVAGRAGEGAHPGRRQVPRRAGDVGVGLPRARPDQVGGERLAGEAVDVAPDVALEVRQAPLPGAARQDPGDGGDEPRVGVGHREPHAAQAPVPEGAEELGPGGLALAVEAGAAEELLVPGGRHADRRDERDARVAPAGPALHVGRVEPHVGVLALDRPGPERLGLLVQPGAQRRHLGAGQRRDAELLGDEPDLAGAHASDVHLAHERDHGHLDARVALEYALGEVGPLAQLGDPQLEVAEGGRQGPLAVAVPAVDALGRPGAAGRAAGLLRLGVHQGVDHGLDHLPAELPQVVAPREQREQGLGLGPVEAEPPVRLG